jgi:hypothetical protein
VPRGHSKQIAVDGEAEPVLAKLGVWVSNNKSRRDKLAQEQHADSPPPDGTRYEPVTKNDELVPATDKWLRHTWHNQRPGKITTNDQHETNISDQLALTDTALAAYVLHLGPTGTVTQQWLDGTRNQLFDLTGAVSRLRTT